MSSKWIGYTLAVVLIVILSGVVYTQVKEHHLQDDPMLHTLKQIMIPVHPVFKDLKLYKGDSSYTLNKNKIFMCLYDENGNYYPLNQLIYVLAHEISHFLNEEDIGHTPAFYKKFDEILDKATELGIYNPSIPIIQGYCEYKK